MDWLTAEISGGGNWDHLNALRQECAYIANLLGEQLVAARSTVETPGSLPKGSKGRIAANIAHAIYHILDDYGEEHAQTGVCTVEIPAFAWTELNEIIDKLGDDPHGALHDLIGVNDPDPPSSETSGSLPSFREVRGILKGTEPAGADQLCEDCPPEGYQTDKTRCAECPRRVAR
ncbi:MAG TPA: hypothetical protein VFX20_18000 [Steroidobacteraceae bacterium]|nr:hypothetical protein [Steroidobacteraceae bacterium]